MTRVAALVAAALVVAWPRIAAACPVCFSADGASREAFLGTTVFLTVLPLITLGVLVWWIRKNYRDPNPPPVRPDELEP